MLLICVSFICFFYWIDDLWFTEPHNESSVLGNTDPYKKEMSKPQSLALGMLIICQ